MPELTEPYSETPLPLDGGRIVNVTAYGNPSGRPLLWFHGTPGGARQIPEALRVSLRRHDVRLLLIERPGYGTSTYHEYEDINQINSDVAVVLELLDVERFSVGGLSGGGPYALAVAHDYPDRVAGAVVLGGVAPHVGPERVDGGAVGLFAPIGPIVGPTSRAVGRLFEGLVKVLTPVAAPAFDLVTRLFPEGDKLVLGQPEMRAMFIQDIIRTASGGLPGPSLDLRLFLLDWGFRLADISVPVHLWHGDADPIVPLRHAEHMAALIPDAALLTRPAESHLGGLAAAEDAVLAALSHW